VDDPFTEALIEAMLTPIADRSNASALVPLVLTVPDETTEKFKYLTFSAPLDAEARNMREEAIRRLALGQDAPPEVLLGTGHMNHWGAWLVEEATITTHVEPRLALICDALTSQFLRPVLIAKGMQPEQAEQYVIWYDVDHLIIRPNRTADAKDLHDSGSISDKAYRDAAGFSDDDAPQETAQVDMAVSTALDLVRAAPSLAQTPGLAALVEQIRGVLEGKPVEDIPAGNQPPPAPVAPVQDQPAEDQPAGQGPPDTQGNPAPAVAASASLSGENLTITLPENVGFEPTLIPVSHGGS
jgi:hypothetical protein